MSLHIIIIVQPEVLTGNKFGSLDPICHCTHTGGWCLVRDHHAQVRNLAEFILAVAQADRKTSKFPAAWCLVFYYPVCVRTKHKAIDSVRLFVYITTKSARFGDSGIRVVDKCHRMLEVVSFYCPHLSTTPSTATCCFCLSSILVNQNALLYNNTVDREIFAVKIFSDSMASPKINHAKIMCIINNSVIRGH